MSATGKHIKDQSRRIDVATSEDVSAWIRNDVRGLLEALVKDGNLDSKWLQMEANTCPAYVYWARPMHEHQFEMQNARRSTYGDGIYIPCSNVSCGATQEYLKRND